MIISSPITRWTLLATALTFSVFGQDAPSAAKTPLDHVIGTISAVDQQAQTVTIQEDKTNTPHVIQLTTTKTLLKVEPSAKDLKSAVRITAGDLEVGDRVDVRGTRQADAPTTLAAKSVILMSGRALAATHEQQAAAWAKATSARVTAVDAASGNITADIRLAGENQSVTVKTSPKTEFTRYSPETGKPAPSQISQIQTGDQLKVVGEKTDGSISAERVYSGAFRTISMTVTSLGADGKTITGKDLTTKKEVVVDVNSGASIHKLPPMMAMMLARRLNPGASMNPAGGPPTGGATGTPGGQVRQGANGQGANGQGGTPAGGPPTGANGAAYSGSPGAGSPGAGGPCGRRTRRRHVADDSTHTNDHTRGPQSRRRISDFWCSHRQRQLASNGHLGDCGRRANPAIGTGAAGWRLPGAAALAAIGA